VSRGPNLPAKVEPVRQADISIFPEFEAELSQAWLQRVLEGALRVALEPNEPAQVSLVIADDATVQELNAQFRGLDEVTDVLSFSANHPGHWQGEIQLAADRYVQPGNEVAFPFPIFDGGPPPLGEVIISLPQARRQAEERDEPLEQELALLIVHGVLHLVGHEHLDPEETTLMQGREQAAKANLFPTDPSVTGPSATGMNL
jgi:probable rRNA maturation factor